MELQPPKTLEALHRRGHRGRERELGGGAWVRAAILLLAAATQSLTVSTTLSALGILTSIQN